MTDAQLLALHGAPARARITSLPAPRHVPALSIAPTPATTPLLPYWRLRRVLTQDATDLRWGLWRYADEAGVYVYNVARSTDPEYPPAGRGGVRVAHVEQLLASKRLRYVK